MDVMGMVEWPFSGPEVIKLFMLTSAEHEISNAPNAHRFKYMKKFGFFFKLR